MKPRSENVSSYVRHKETVSFKLELKTPKQPEIQNFARWKCSCGSQGRWQPTTTPFWRTGLFAKWQTHVKTKHSDFVL